jgi:hypothetical protein
MEGIEKVDDASAPPLRTINFLRLSFMTFISPHFIIFLTHNLTYRTYNDVNQKSACSSGTSQMQPVLFGAPLFYRRLILGNYIFTVLTNNNR